MALALGYLFVPIHAAHAAEGYAQPGLLVETDWVQTHSNAPGIRLVDMRNSKAYDAGHIPQAVHVDEGPLRNPEERFTYLPRPEQFAAMMGKAGIDNATDVVIYDDQGGKKAARLWYVLHAFGHTHVRLVNGGWRKWTAEQRPVSTVTPSVVPATFAIKVTPDMTCPLPEFLARKPNVLVLDARSPEEYGGSVLSPGAKREGRVPGAVNVEWRENVTAPDFVFKSARDLRQMYAAKGITPNKEIVVLCAGGGRAAQSLFTLSLLGYPHIKVYYGSFSDYSALPDAPIEK